MTVLLITNLNYAKAPKLIPQDAHIAAALNWQEVRLTGNSVHEYAEQIEQLGAILDYGWQTCFAYVPMNVVMRDEDPVESHLLWGAYESFSRCCWRYSRGEQPHS